MFILSGYEPGEEGLQNGRWTAIAGSEDRAQVERFQAQTEAQREKILAGYGAEAGMVADLSGVYREYRIEEVLSV